MRRRKLLSTGATIVLGSVAGCSGGDGEDSTTAEPEGQETSEPAEQSAGGEASFSVEPSATEIDWGDDYSVEVTVQEPV